MPRLDRTFSSADVIRVYQAHLTREEQADVDAFFRARLVTEPVEPDAGIDELTERLIEKWIDTVEKFIPGFGLLLTIIAGITDALREVTQELLGPFVTEA